MNRRSLLVAAGAVGLTTAVGSAAAALAAGEPEHRQPALLWELTGGFVPPGWSALRPPRLAAYDDGVLIADAARRLQLDAGELRSLRNHATAVLRDPANARRRPGAPMIADVPSTVFTARANGRRFRLQFVGLEETRQDRAYPMPAYSLLDHAAQLYDRADRTGSPWRPDAVRLIAVVIDPATPAGPPPPWPAGVPVPQLRKDELVAQLDLRDRQARALIHALPHPDSVQWKVFRTPDGTLMQVNWRYRLPHE